MSKAGLTSKGEGKSSSSMPPYERKKKKRVLPIIMVGAVLVGSVFVIQKSGDNAVTNKLRSLPVIGGLFGESGTTEVTMSYDELVTALAQSQEEVATLEKEKANLEMANDTLTNKVKSLSEYEANYENFLKQKEAWDMQVAENNPDLFIEQFEAMYPEIAENIYSRLKGNNIITKEQKKYSSTVAQMDSDQAAKAVEALISTDTELIKVIFDNMGQEQSAAILSGMSTEGAAKVLKLISPEVKVN